MDDQSGGVALPTSVQRMELGGVLGRGARMTF